MVDGLLPYPVKLGARLILRLVSNISRVKMGERANNAGRKGKSFVYAFVLPCVAHLQICLYRALLLVYVTLRNTLHLLNASFCPNNLSTRYVRVQGRDTPMHALDGPG